jgi:hypothetical protein
VRVLYDRIKFPIEHPPEGAEKIDRWYQLDPPALSLVEWWARRHSELTPPGGVILASPLGSNESDFAFVKSGFLSPQKFVHTLSSVRATPLFQMMGWSGPVLCLQRDPFTISSALLEAELLTSEWKKVWVLGVDGGENGETVAYGIVLFELTCEEKRSGKNIEMLNDRELLKRVKEGQWND